MRRSRLLATAGLLVVLLAIPLSADVRLPHVIGSHMVLQRDMPLPIWGWADAGEEVTVKIADRRATTTADDQGRWKVRLKPLPAGGPFDMTVAGKNTITLTDILIGEVWVGSGQSNMQLSVRRAAFPQRETAAADYPKIRLFEVPRKPAGKPVDDVDAQWRVCSPAAVSGFSAVAYYFGRKLHKELDVPVGLIESAWGGTRIEPWTSQAGFAGVPGFDDVLERIAEAESIYAEAVAQTLPRYEAWLTEVRKAFDAGKSVSKPPAWPVHPLASQKQPTGLYNAMIHPLVPFAIRGAIWYQGEASCGDGAKYAEMMKALIGGWRGVWGEGDFPFYFVQIAPYSKLYGKDQLPILWEAQTAAMAIPNTGMIVTTDIGNVDDIHPNNKQDVGRRLALWALAKTYGRDNLVCSGPLYKSMTVESHKVRLSFDYVGGGLTSRNDGPLNWFEIAGEDRKFVPARGTIDGETVVVSSDKVAAPVAVRFGWDNAAEPNLMNKEGLPASPFRTDRW